MNETIYSGEDRNHPLPVKELVNMPVQSLGAQSAEGRWCRREGHEGLRSDGFSHNLPGIPFPQGKPHGVQVIPYMDTVREGFCHPLTAASGSYWDLRR